MPIDLLAQWKSAVANNHTQESFDAWCRENDPEVQEDFNKKVEEALNGLFGADAMRRVRDDQDPEAFDLTVCLSAQQRLTCYVGVTVPGVCDETTAEQLASRLDDDMDSSHYELDPEYWEGLTPCVDGMD